MPPIVPPYESSFELAVAIVLQHEGGYVDDPKDPGGETNFGISKKMIRDEGLSAADLGLVDLEPGRLNGLTLQTARALYKRFFWDKHGYGRLLDQTVATKVFDCAVNTGPHQAHLLAQRVAEVHDDGILGPISVAAINAMPAKAFVDSYAKQMEHFYRTLTVKRPALGVFLPNWLKRAGWGTSPATPGATHG